MHTRFRVAVLFLGCALSLRAQSPGEPKPDARRLQLGTDTLDISLVRQGQQQRTGMVIDRLDTVHVGGEVLLRRVYRRIDLVLGSGVDTLVDHFPDLVPRGIQSRSEAAGTEILAWRGNRVTGTVEQPGKPKRSIDATVGPSVYSSTSFDLILRASPLADAYEVIVSAYSGRQGARTLKAKVIGTEAVSGFGDTWRVDADFGGLSVTFWIAKASRRLIREVIRAASGTELLLVARSGSRT